jgi:3D (Asp-Asp-Asp) domain-containing protein
VEPGSLPSSFYLSTHHGTPGDGNRGVVGQKMKHSNWFWIIFYLLLLICTLWGWSVINNGRKPCDDGVCEVRFIKNYRPCEDGIGSWYGSFHHGRLMANGKRFNMYSVSVAHKTLPLGTKIRVINLSNGKSIIATVTDRGPYIKGRIVDMSYGAAQILGMVKAGIVPVRILKC